jgi:2-polyprenyl-3-methyl-5-hydroxy-6-metoxy-1,4-benzoquinol methylase
MCARYGFIYRVGERGPQFAAWIGTGKRVLDLGCRDGSLTRYYVEGNIVVGVDIDQQALSLLGARWDADWLGTEQLSLARPAGISGRLQH